MFNYSFPQIDVTVVPGELTLTLSISGCPLRCKGCHSSFTWDKNYGIPLTHPELERLLERHKHITCVLFYGGEWESDYLIELLSLVEKKNLKTCLFTGLNSIDESILTHLNFVKYGPYVERLGPLDSPTTNQRLINLDTQSDITHLLQ